MPVVAHLDVIKSNIYSWGVFKITHLYYAQQFGSSFFNLSYFKNNPEAPKTHFQSGPFLLLSQLISGCTVPRGVEHV